MSFDTTSAHAVVLSDVQATHEFGRRLAAAIESPLVIALTGPLGAGKTTFTQGFAAGLGVAEPVSSPTFVLCSYYQGRLPLAHLDAYRLPDAVTEDALQSLGIDELFASDHVCVVEWAERLSAWLPPDRLEIRFDHALQGRTAVLTVIGAPQTHIEGLIAPCAVARN